MFSRYGGHARAAGFTLPTKNIGAFREHLERYPGSEKAAAALYYLARLGGESQLQGQGETSRETVLTTTLSARVTHVLPNGYLVIEGIKDIQVNSERQQVLVRGVASLYEARGVVESVSPETGQVVIDHEDVPVSLAFALDLFQRLACIAVPERPPFHRSFVRNGIRAGVRLGRIVGDLDGYGRLVRGNENEAHVQIEAEALVGTHGGHDLFGIRMDGTVGDVFVPGVILGEDLQGRDDGVRLPLCDRANGSHERGVGLRPDGLHRVLVHRDGTLGLDELEPRRGEPRRSVQNGRDAPTGSERGARDDLIGRVVAPESVDRDANHGRCRYGA